MTFLLSRFREALIKGFLSLARTILIASRFFEVGVAFFRGSLGMMLPLFCHRSANFRCTPRQESLYLRRSQRHDKEDDCPGGTSLFQVTARFPVAACEERSESGMPSAEVRKWDGEVGRVGLRRC